MVIMNQHYYIFIILILTMSTIPLIFSAKILSVTFFSSKSHKIIYEPLLHKLASRGHQVTDLSPVINNEVSIPNLKQILTINVEEGMKSMVNFFEKRERGEYIDPFIMCMNRFQELCTKSYALPQVKAILNEKFDLVIFQPIFNECTAGFIYKLNTTIILITPFSVPSTISSLLGTPSSLSIVPNMFSGFTDKMNIFERGKNLLIEMKLIYKQNWEFKPKMEAIYRKALNDYSIPGVDDILRNASIILSNSHFSLNRPRPLLPNIIEVAGMHCREAKELPKDLEVFVKSSGSNGFIYLNFGSALKGILLPEKYRKEFIKAFAQLKQNVIWKWETETMPDLPKNVKLSQWLPQQDILGHPNIKAFITHAGLGSFTESFCHGVPILAIPIYGDQFQNAKLAEENGMGIKMEFEDISSENILNAINKILDNPKYQANARQLSQIFQDQPDNPLDRAVFWTEYVIRHKGALSLISSARELNFVQYYFLDIALIVIAIISIIIYTAFIFAQTISEFKGKLQNRKNKSE